MKIEDSTEVADIWYPKVAGAIMTTEFFSLWEDATARAIRPLQQATVGNGGYICVTDKDDQLVGPFAPTTDHSPPTTPLKIS